MYLPISTAVPALVRLIESHVEAEKRDGVRTPRDPADLHEAIDIGLSEEPMSLPGVEALLTQILAVTPSTATPRFFNQLFAGRDGAAFLGEVLASLLNNSMYTYKVAGIHVLMELELVRRMGAMLGFDDPEGVFTPGGSLSNLCGLVMARNEAVENAKNGGVDGRTLRVYTSADGHYSIPKAAGILGIGRENVVKVPTDARGRMDAAALDAAIESDKRAGLLPVMINATTATTVRGAFDPLDAIADVGEAHGVWLHVDGAYGGSMLFHPEFKYHFKGIARADSVTWDAHKMMGVPLTCSVIFSRKKGLLTKHFNETASYLFQDDTDDLNPGTRSIQCGRRNDVLKLWTAWKVHGDSGFRSRMVALRDLALHAAAEVKARPTMHLVCEPESLNVCFTVDGMEADVLCTALNVRGLAMVGHAFIGGRAVVRAVFLDPATTTADVDTLLDALEMVAAENREATS